MKSLVDLMVQLKETDDGLQHADRHYRLTGELVDGVEATVAAMKKLLDDAKKVYKKINKCMSDA